MPLVAVASRQTTAPAAYSADVQKRPQRCNVLNPHLAEEQQPCLEQLE